MRLISKLCLFLLASCSAYSVNPVIAIADTQIKYVRNYDGDTLVADLVDLKKMDKNKEFTIFWRKISIRLRGIDTPEMNSDCIRAYALARTAQKLLEDTLSDADSIIISNVSRDKYFRVVADVHADGVDMAQMMIEKELAVKYDGKKKTHDWCDYGNKK